MSACRTGEQQRGAESADDRPEDLRGADDHLGIDQPRGPDDLLDDLLGDLPLVGTGRGGDEDDLIDLAVELLPAQGSVVPGGREAEAILDQGVLARHVAGIHAVELRDRLVRLIDDDQEVVREVVQQRVRRRAGPAAVQVPRVVLDAVAVADLAHHLDVVARALLQPLRLQELDCARGNAPAGPPARA